MRKQVQGLLIVPFAAMLIETALVAKAEPAPNPAQLSDRPTSVNNNSSYVNVNTQNRYSNSSSQYHFYLAPDGSYVSNTSVRVSYPGGTSNTDVQVVIPPDVAAGIRAFWQKMLNPASTPQR